MTRLQVGKSRIAKTKKNGEKTRSYAKYKDIPKSPRGWVDASLYLPRKYDLVRMRLHDDTIQVGWRNTASWEGVKYKGETVIEWKKIRIDSNHNE